MANQPGRGMAVDHRTPHNPHGPAIPARRNTRRRPANGCQPHHRGTRPLCPGTAASACPIRLPIEPRSTADRSPFDRSPNARRRLFERPSIYRRSAPSEAPRRPPRHWPIDTRGVSTRPGCSVDVSHFGDSCQILPILPFTQFGQHFKRGRMSGCPGLCCVHVRRPPAAFLA